MRDIKHSQNFIRNKSLVDNLIRKTNISKNDTVLEVGTGTGIITERLCNIARKVISIEKDKNLYKVAEKRLQRFGNLELVNKDFFDFSLPTSNYKCFSNIPFNRTANVIRKLFLSKNAPVSSYLVLQIESADRFLGINKSNQISLLLSPLYSSEIIHRFRRHDFVPSPFVDIVLAAFERRFPPEFTGEKYSLYKDFITYCFNKWSKSIKKGLLDIFTYKQLKFLTRKLKFNLHNKPSTLKYEQWAGLFRFMQDHPYQTKWSMLKDYYRTFLEKHKKQKPEHRTRVRCSKSYS